MARFRVAVPTRDCYAMAIGNKELRAKDGFVETDSPSEAALLMKVGSKSVIGQTSTGGKFCTGCAFYAHSWTARCPRCGSVTFIKE